MGAHGRPHRSARRGSAMLLALAIAALMAAPAAGESVLEEPGPPPEFERVVEVDAERHAAGEYTVQDAFDELAETGGVVELGAGEFELDRATTSTDVPVRIVGQGPEETIITGHIALILSPAPYAELTELSFRDLYRGVVLTDDGRYGHVKFHRVHFTDISHNSIRGGVPGPIDRITVTECRFENVHSGAGFRNRESRQMKVSDNEFHNVTTRPMVLGSGGGDNRYAEITNNHIDGVGPGRHPIGILAYVDHTLIAENTIKNIHNDGRHEAISSRGRHTVIRDNTMIDAGGHTAAISLAASGPTTIKNNVIRFTDEHKGRRDGIDCRQTGLEIVGNEITGSRRAINLRRGGLSRIADNHIGDSRHQLSAVTVSISTGGTVPAERMRDVRIENNTVSGIVREDGSFRAIRFNIRNHAGDHDTRMDDVVIANNRFTDIDVAEGSRGVVFSNVSRDDSHMRNVVIENNDFSGIDDPVHSSRTHVEDLRIADNVGVADEP